MWNVEWALGTLEKTARIQIRFLMKKPFAFSRITVNLTISVSSKQTLHVLYAVKFKMDLIPTAAVSNDRFERLWSSTVSVSRPMKM